MGNRFVGVEEVRCEKDIYTFKVDFNFLASVQQEIGNPLELYSDICNGIGDPEIILGLMIASVKSKNGKVIKEVKSEMENLITRNGLQDSWMLCRHLLAYSMIGDVKKSQLRKLKPNKLTQLITEPFLLESSKNRRLLWAYHLLISGICVCISFSLFVLLLT